MKKLIFFLKELVNTFWFIPVVIILISIGLAIGLTSLDGLVNLTQKGLSKYFFVNSADSARSILSTISGAMIGVAGTVFSVTLVALTLASSQFGPRLIKNFMYVRLNQVVLGAYISTYLYCLIVLNTIKENEGFTFVPSLSILAAIIVAIVNIILLIVFIHQIAISLQADKIISDISESISSQIKELFPENMGEESEILEPENEEAAKSAFRKTFPIRGNKSGYLQYIDSESLMDMARDMDGIVELGIRPGQFIVENEEIGRLYYNEEREKNPLGNISDHFIIGKTRTPNQDLEFSILQMVEIAARALSPGVNDPFTAVACIDNLTSSIAKLSQVNFPSRFRFDQDKKLRVIANTFTFEGIVNAAFNQIRQFSTGSPSVIIRLMEAMITLEKFAHNENQKKTILKHAKMILNVGKESISEENDLNDLLERSMKLIKN
jgi:uncharacterized membrane protein